MVDGAHIRILWLTYIYRYMRPLLEAGYVYFACPPLYKITKKKKDYYAYTDKEKEDKIAELGGMEGVSIQRYKGLGEMDATQLWDTTMNPEERTLIQVTVEDAEAANDMVSLCMGDDVPPRKQYIIENAKFAVVDA